MLRNVIITDTKEKEETEKEENKDWVGFAWAAYFLLWSGKLCL